VGRRGEGFCRFGLSIVLSHLRRYANQHHRSTIIAILIFNPLLLVVDLLLLLRSHYRSVRISNRAGMLWSTCLAVYFVLVALGTVWMNTFPSSKIDYSLVHTVALTRDSCWQYDKTMYTLDRWSRWAKGIERGCEVLGMLGAVW